MQIFPLQVGQMQANCYLLVHGSNCLIIDPGDDGSTILEYVLLKNLNISAIVLTHGHFDHVMALGEIQSSFDVPVYVHEADIFLLERMQASANYYLTPQPYLLPIQYDRVIKMSRFSTIKVDTFDMRVIHTPGHTPGSCCYFFSEQKIMFTGDTVFKNAIGRYDFRYSDKKLLDQSLQQIFSFPPETILYPGHGEKTCIADEKEKNFLS